MDLYFMLKKCPFPTNHPKSSICQLMTKYIIIIIMPKLRSAKKNWILLSPWELDDSLLIVWISITENRSDLSFESRISCFLDLGLKNTVKEGVQFL